MTSLMVVLMTDPSVVLPVPNVSNKNKSVLLFQPPTALTNDLLVQMVPAGLKSLVVQMNKDVLWTLH